jgi:alcohol dehydrogenase
VTARALVLENARTLVPADFPLPEIGTDDGLLRVEACGLCGTDHELYTGHLPGPHPFVPGHETIGIIEQIGPGAAARWGVSAGDRVAVEVFLSCRECEACSRGEYRRCERHGLGDMYGNVRTDTAPALWGGYATHQYLAPDSMLLKVPDDLDPVLATVFNPLGAGFRWAVTVPETVKGDVVAVLGPGIRGLSCLAAAKEAGASFAMVTGVAPNDAERLRRAASFGADLAVDVSSTDPAAELKRATGGLADVVVDVTAKAPAALAQAISLVRPGGTIVMAGTRGSAETPGFWPDLIVYKEIRILGALGVDTTAYRQALTLLESGKYPFDELPRTTASLDSLESLIQTMAGEGAEPPPVHGVLVPELSDRTNDRRHS